MGCLQACWGGRIAVTRVLGGKENTRCSPRLDGSSELFGHCD